jgi:hypothetical protein
VVLIIDIPQAWSGIFRTERLISKKIAESITDVIIRHNIKFVKEFWNGFNLKVYGKSA